MKKVLGIIAAIIVITVGLGYLAYANSSMILAKIISQKTLTPVSIGNILWEKSKFILEDLTIKNPPHTELPTATKVQTIEVESAYSQYFKNPILIDKIHLDNVYVNIQIYNKDQTEGNWHTIMNNMLIDHESPLSIERPAHIKKLVLTNIQIDLILSDGKLRRLSPINHLEFDNVNSENGIPTQEISEIIVQKVMGSIFLEKGLKAIIETPVDIIKGVIPFL